MKRTLILYTDASKVSIGGVLMQEHNGVEKSNCAFVFCVKQLTPCLMGKMDHKNLVYLANSAIPKLVGLPPLRVPISHPTHPGCSKCCGRRTHKGNILLSMEIARSKRHMFMEDLIPGVFWLGGEELTSRSPRRDRKRGRRGSSRVRRP